MSDLFDLTEKPTAEKRYMLVGWRQWADAGSISSGLPEYLIKFTDAHKIGSLKSNGYYIFQVPGTHHLMRPVIKLKEGYRQEMEEKRNEIFYSGDDETGLYIFLGDEPHMNVETYAGAFFAAAKELGVQRVIGFGGVYGSIPYDRDRYISCIYSLPHMKQELNDYAVNFSNYEGGSSVGSYLVHRAEVEGIEFIVFYGFAPAYEFSRPQAGGQSQGLRIENDYKAWHDIMRRVNHMLELGLSLTDLQIRSNELVTAIDEKIDELEKESPQLKVREQLARLEEGFEELPFLPLDDVWQQGLQGLFEDFDE